MLPTSGPISMSMIQKELGITGPISLNSPEVRKLAGKPSGEIRMSDLYGKSKFEGYMFDMTVGYYGDRPRRYDRFCIYYSFGYGSRDPVHPGKVNVIDSTIPNCQIRRVSFGDPRGVTSFSTKWIVEFNRKIGNRLNLTIDGIGSWDLVFHSDIYGYGEYWGADRLNYCPIAGYDQKVVRCTIKVIS